MSSQQPQSVFFPVETTGRELAGHILLGTRLASRGVNAVIGHVGPVKRLVQTFDSSGVVFYKGDARVDLFGRPDFVYVGQDPETGITLRRFEDHVARRPKIFRHLDGTSAYFAFGRHDYSYLVAEFPQLLNKVHLTGSPRATLWGPLGDRFYETDIEQIKSQYGSFCLAVSRGGRGDRFDKRQHADRRAQVAKTAQNLLQKMHALRDETGFNIVIRPHPSESWREWKQAVRDAPGIHVETCFDLSAWIRAAKFVVQAPTSTASFEAWMTGTPSVASEAPEPHIGKDGSSAEFVAHELCVPHSVWGSAFDYTAVLREYEALRASPRASALVQERLFSPESDATLRMSEIIERLTSEARSSEVRPSIGVSVSERFRPHSLGRVLHQERLGRRIPPPHKRWALSPSRIDAQVRRAEELIDVEGNVKTRWLLPNCFVLERA